MSQFLTPATEPLGMIWGGFVLLVLWRLWRRQWSRLAWPTLAAILLAFIGCEPITCRILATLERPYAGTDLKNLPPADAVVMLGGVLEYSESDLAGINLSSTSDRMMMAAELMKLRKARALVLGGGGPRAGEDRPLEGELVKRYLASAGLGALPVALLGNCRNTHDEAVRATALISKYGWKRIILVTSASHMRRGEALFLKLGVRPVCVACDFDGLGKMAHPSPTTIFPRWEALRFLSLYCHERIGYYVYRLYGWI